MSETLTPDERYFRWLYSQIADESTRDPSESHGLLCETLYKIPFEWSVRNDKNRSSDGKALREEYLDSTGDQVPKDWYDLDCSMFEMLVALARRAAFQTGWRPDVWFWTMLTNVELMKYHDEIYHDGINDAVVRSMSRIIHREYEPSGRGGFFPLRDPERDQREVEIWYQLSAYLLENIDF